MTRVILGGFIAVKITIRKLTSINTVVTAAVIRSLLSAHSNE